MEIGENRFRPGPAKAGYQAGFVLRFNLTRRLHLQSELNFAFVNYSIRAEGSRARSVSLRSERFEIPLLLGLQFGPLRLFGGAQFRVADSERDSAPKLLKVNFNDDVGIMGGVGLIQHPQILFRLPPVWLRPFARLEHLRLRRRVAAGQDPAQPRLRRFGRVLLLSENKGCGDALFFCTINNFANR